jgi:tripartite-type tricarboxylate transporter receptor subunit TctC
MRNVPITRRELIHAGAAGLATLTLPGAARAQGTAWPTKPIRFVVPFALGGG